jgi:integrase
VPDERRAPAFGAFAEQWVEERRSRWKPSTLAQYQQVFRSHFTPAFGDVRVSSINESRVLQLVTQLPDAGLSARRTNLVLLVLKMILRTARRRRPLREDALVGVKMLREPRTEVDALAPEEVDAYLTACPPWWRPYFVTAFRTGIRPNEAAALKLGNVDAPGVRFRIRAGRYARYIPNRTRRDGSALLARMATTTSQTLASVGAAR